MQKFCFWKRTLLAAVMLTLGAGLGSCSNDDTNDDTTIPEIEVTQSLLFDCAETQTKELEIKLNGKIDWKIETNADWIETAPASGKGSATVKVTVPANETSRTGVITVTATGYMGITDEGKCTVKQTPGGVDEGPETNVAEIRSLVLENEPGGDETDLSDEIRAKSLQGIVVSDKGGGNQQPFIVNIADDTQEGGAGVALEISQSNNTFEPGDVIAVSLSDATAQLFNGLLQISTHNKPELVEHIEPLDPVVITADKIGAYESQYVKIEHTQPEASESGTWNSSSNKGNVSMETLDGQSYKIRTIQNASFASEPIPTDKSGSIAGIAGIYNTTLQLSPRNIDDIQLTEERFTVTGSDATLEEVLAAEPGSTFSVKEATVIGHNEQGVLLQQGDARMYAFKGAAHGLEDGDIVTVTGKTESRNGLLQFGKGCSFDKTGHDDNPARPEPAAFSAAEIEAYMDAPEVKYVTYTGVVLVSGNYTNVEIEGTSVQGSLDYMSEDFKKKYNNHEVEITGWLFGSYKSYMYTIPAEVEDLGEYEEVVPEGAIYYSTFDKELASQTYGTGSSWPYLDQFDGWINHKGSGANDVTYDFKSMSVRANQSSKGDLSLYDGSGKNNIFFSTAPNHFTIEKIAVTDRNLQLSFGAQRYAQGASNAFLKSNFEVRVSQDGQTWSQALEYDFDVADDPGQWRLAKADFTLPEGVSTLYIKFVAVTSSVNRIDDVLLKAGNGGQQIVFGGSEEIEKSTIADVLAAPTDKKYAIEGQVIATHTKGFLVKDATGTILVFKKNHGTEIGDKVAVTGPTTEYGGMKQFDETGEIETLGKGSFTQPAPDKFSASDFDAYVKNPAIRYVEYVGTLTSYRDEIYQTHYNVLVDGTAVQGSVLYPNGDLNVEALVDREVKVTGYAIGVSGSTTKYLNTMTVSLEATEQETMPDESTALTVRELNEKLASATAGDKLKDLVAVKGYVAANNEGGNLYQVISLVDNTGEAKSGILIKGEDHTEKTLPVGTKVVVSLRYAEYDNYQGLPQLLKATVFATEEKAEMKVPEITDAEAADYLGQYVTVKNLTPAKDATTWVVDGKTTTTDFTGETGETIPARVTRYAEFADEKIAQKTANLTGVMEVYKGTYQLYPTSREDVAGFSEK